MSLDINSTQTIKISSVNQTIKSRLDLLYLTFIIEEDLERRIKKIIPNRRTKLSEIKELMINETIANEFLDFNTGKNPGKIVRTIEGIKYFYINEFIANTTFGGLVKILETMKDNVSIKVFDDLRAIVNWSVIKKWYENIKDLRNILAHRSAINMETLFIKMPMPATPSNKGIFSDLSDTEKRKYLLTFFLTNNMDKEVERIFSKFNI